MECRCTWIGGHERWDRREDILESEEGEIFLAKYCFIVRCDAIPSMSTLHLKIAQILDRCVLILVTMQMRTVHNFEGVHLQIQLQKVADGYLCTHSRAFLGIPRIA